MARSEEYSANEIDSKLQQLEKRIDTLKKRYRRYFLGTEQVPPNAMRKQVVREVFELEQTFINNTAQKFKLRSLVQSFNTHKTRWNRVMRQIEEGTYVRDVKRAKRRRQEHKKKENKQQGAFELNDSDFIEDIQEIDLDSVFEQPSGREPIMPSKQPSQPQPRSTPQAAPSNSGPSKEQIKKRKLAEIQRKLGLGGGQQTSNASPSPQPQRSTSGGSNSQGEPTRSAPQRSSSRPSSSGSGSATPSSRQRKLQKLKKSLSNGKKQEERKIRRSQSSSGNSSSTNTGSHRRVVRRSRSDDDAKK